jgi:hypothetical protein
VILGRPAPGHRARERHDGLSSLAILVMRCYRPWRREGSAVTAVRNGPEYTSWAS